MAQNIFYMLFSSSTEAMRAYTELHDAGCRVRISPAPRLDKVCCGTALRISQQDIEGVRTVLNERPDITYDRIIETEDITNTRRDRFC